MVLLGRVMGPLAAAVLFGACATGGARNYVFYPPPPDTARFQFLVGFSSLDDMQASSRSVLSALVGEERKSSPVRILRPYGVTGDSGLIYVCDVNLPGVSTIDLAERTIRQIQSPTLPQPSNCVLDRATGELYVVDNTREEVVIIGTDGIYAGVVNENLRAPGGVAVTEDRVWVTDLGTRQVKVYEKGSGRFLRAFPDPDLAEDDSTALRWPLNVAVRHDRVYVVDQFAARVQVYTTDGEYLLTAGRRGAGFGAFDVPKGVAVDRAGRIYVADFQFHHVQVFSGEGRVLTYVGGGGVGRPGYLGGPIGVAIDEENTEFFREYVHPDYELEFLLLVTNQLGADKLSVYGFIEPKGAR